MLGLEVSEIGTLLMIILQFLRNSLDETAKLLKKYFFLSTKCIYHFVTGQIIIHTDFIYEKGKFRTL